MQQNLEDSDGRVRSDWIEPEVLFWAVWRRLPRGEQAAIAREVVGGFLERVECAAAMDPRPGAQADPMEPHRHRIQPLLWGVLEAEPGALEADKDVRHEYRRWAAQREVYLARRPIWSPMGTTPPWEAEN
jgi:hypothetical protein